MSYMNLQLIMNAFDSCFFSVTFLVFICYIGYITDMITLTFEVVVHSVKVPISKDVLWLLVCVLHVTSHHMTFLRQYVLRLTKHYYCPDFAPIDSHSKIKAIYYYYIYHRGIIIVSIQPFKFNVK